MKKWLVLTPALLLCAAPLLPVRAAELDEVQSHLLTPYQLPLRWENVASSPCWLGGVKPTFRLHAGMHVVDLPAGGEVTFYVPPESAIRVVNPSGDLAPADVEVSVSDGSGLHV